MEEREETAGCFSQKNKTKQRETNWLESASRQPVDGEAGRKKKKNTYVGHFHHGGISSRRLLQQRRHLRPRVIVSRSLSRTITQPQNLPSAGE